MKKKAENATAQAAQTQRAVVCIRMAAVRSEPKECAPIGTLNYGECITITGEKNGFYQMKNGLWVRTYAVRKASK